MVSILESNIQSSPSQFEMLMYALVPYLSESVSFRRENFFIGTARHSTLVSMSRNRAIQLS